MLALLRRAGPPATLAVLGALSACGVNPKASALVDDEIAHIGSASEVGISPDDLAAIDSAVLLGDLEALHRLIARGLRTPAEIARMNSRVLALQARWKSVR